MDIQKALSGSGLTEGEIKVYLALVKHGSVPVNKIKQTTGLHRTTIYDFLEKLHIKGLITYVTKGKVRHYSPTYPEKILELLQEKETEIRSALPELKKIWHKTPEEISVSVHKGKEGLKTLLNDILHVGKDILIYGVEDSDWERVIPYDVDNYAKKEAESGVHVRVLTHDETTFIYGWVNNEYRYIPREFFNPTNTIVYGNKSAIVIWEPVTVIIIDNAHVADANRKYFEMLWKNAKKQPKKPLKTVKYK